AGNQRFDILLAQGVERILVSVVDLPLEREKQLNIGLNAIDGEWDNDVLAEVLAELTKTDDSLADAIGFSSSEIDQILADYTANDSGHAERDEDAIRPATDAAAITQPGEIIELGGHRLVCGDGTNPSTLEQLFGDDRAHMLHTDPPYNVDYNTADRPTAKAAAGSAVGDPRYVEKSLGPPWGGLCLWCSSGVIGRSAGVPSFLPCLWWASEFVDPV
ncbi:MAG: hypothetical protein AAFO89_11075, partial [Planctomycetota bacterium]